MRNWLSFLMTYNVPSCFSWRNPCLSSCLQILFSNASLLLAPVNQMDAKIVPAKKMMQAAQAKKWRKAKQIIQRPACHSTKGKDSDDIIKDFFLFVFNRIAHGCIVLRLILAQKYFKQSCTFEFYKACKSTNSRGKVIFFGSPRLPVM